MAYRNNKVNDLRLVKASINCPLTIDLGKSFSGTITAFMKTSYDSVHYREFSVDATGRYISLTKNQAQDIINNGIFYEVEGRWYLNVFQVKDGESEDDRRLIYTGKILFTETFDSNLGSDEGDVRGDINPWFFQFSDVEYDIDEYYLITSNFLSTNGQQFTESQMLDGQSISILGVGRYGFYIENTTTSNQYEIWNSLDIEITDTFEHRYENGKTYYISKEIATPSTIYFKLKK